MLVNVTLRLLLNLSFDPKLRQEMVKAALLPQFAEMMSECLSPTLPGADSNRFIFEHHNLKLDLSCLFNVDIPCHAYIMYHKCIECVH